MFGTFRAILALMVVALHLGGIPALGNYAVFAFYCLSGYLMTLILQRNYGYTLAGFSKYIFNRFLKIYPVYWVSILFTLALVVMTTYDVTRDFHRAIYLPVDYWDTFRNVFLFFPHRDPPRLTPPAWALTVEIFFYLLIGLGLSKSKKTSLLWFGFSVLYHVIISIVGLGREYTYFSIYAASLPFSTGAIIYHYNDKLQNMADRFMIVKSNYRLYILALLIMLNWIFGLVFSTTHGVSFYISFILFSIMILVLSGMKKLPYISLKLDEWFGNLSYPMYLIHYQIGLSLILIFSQMGVNFERPDLTLMLIAIPFVVVCSWLIHELLEQPIGRIREKVKRELRLTR